MLVDNINSFLESHRNKLVSISLSSVLLLSGCAQTIKKIEGANVTEFKPSLSCPTENGPVEIGGSVTVENDKGSGIPHDAVLLNGFNGGYYNLCGFGEYEKLLVDDEGHILTRLQLDKIGNLKFIDRIMFTYGKDSNSYQEKINVEDLSLPNSLGRLKLSSRSSSTAQLNNKPEIPITSPVKELSEANGGNKLIVIGSITLLLSVIVGSIYSVIKKSKEYEEMNEERDRKRRGIYK